METRGSRLASIRLREYFESNFCETDTDSSSFEIVAFVRRILIILTSRNRITAKEINRNENIIEELLVSFEFSIFLDLSRLFSSLLISFITSRILSEEIFPVLRD